VISQLFRTKNIDQLIASSEEAGHRLNRSLGLWSLVGLGIGAVIGSGIFTLTGTAAAGQSFKYESMWHATVLDLMTHGQNAISLTGRSGAGPGIVLSFVLVAFACALAGICYAELASMIPIAGSAYTYAYATLGEIVAWIIGWDLILEYAVSNMAVAVGFSAYFNSILSLFGFTLPPELTTPPMREGTPTGAWFNLPAFVVLFLLTVLLVRGVKEGALGNNLMVIIKTIAILLFVGGAASAIKGDNYTPFMPNGFPGVVTGAAIVFFTYIGFDSVSTAAEECKRPQRDLPLGILLTLVACTLLYGSVAFVLTGIQSYQELNNAAPVANALKYLAQQNPGSARFYRLIGIGVSAGALIGMLSSLLVFQYGQARVWFAMSRDRLLPDLFSRVHPKFRTPHISTWIAGIVVGIPAGIWDIDTFADLSNIGTLFAFVVVSAGVIMLRRKQPDRPRSFRVPLVPLLPMMSIGCCVFLMLGLPVMTWVRFGFWLVLGLVIYFAYGQARTRRLMEQENAG
jgi:APA family basic amino acid/polyamine antiporter